MSLRGWFVTGTDTGVGKTVVAAALCAALRQRGLRPGPLKPVETGCRPRRGRLHPADAARLRAAAGRLDWPLARVCPLALPLPAAPAVAAAAAGRQVDPAALCAAARAAAADSDFLVVEGAGGLLVPLTADSLQADLAAALGLPLLLVARASLGTINHTLLTLAEARRRGLRVAAVILSRTRPRPGPDEATNAAEIERHGAVRVAGTLPHLDAATRRDPARLAAALEAAVDVAALLAAAT